MRSGIRTRRAQRARQEELRQELTGLRDSLADAYGLFNRTADPALLEASILEISALLVRYDRLLRDIKNLNGDEYHDPHRSGPAGHRRGTDQPAVEAAAQADEMGV